MTGDILVGIENIQHGTSGLYRLHWNGTQLQTIPVPLATNSTQPVQYEDIYFTPMGIGSIPPAPPPTTGLPNWPINLENSSGQVIASTMTDAHGNYVFNNVAAGTYIVAEVQQTGWTELRLRRPARTASPSPATRSLPASISATPRTTRRPSIPARSSHSSYAGDTNATVGQQYTYTAVAADADHDQITYSLGLAQPGMVIDPTLGVIDWTPTANEVGFQNVDIVGQRRQRQHRHPVLHHRRLARRLAAGDHDHGAAHRLSRSRHTRTRSRPSRPIIIPSPSACRGRPSGMSITAAGLLTWPGPGARHSVVTIDATDNHNGVGTKTFTLQVVTDPGTGMSLTSTPPRVSPARRTIRLPGRRHRHRRLSADLQPVRHRTPPA